MAAPSYTYTLANSTTADADEVMQNFNDILNGVSDGSKDLSINALTVAGAASFNGAVTLGNATGDDLTATGRWAADMDPKTAATYALGSSSLPWQSINIDNGATDGGAVYFGGSTTDFLKSDATTGGDLTMGGFTALDLGAGASIKTFGVNTVAKSADYTILDTDGVTVILATAGSSADITMTLPTAADNTGRIITIKKVDAGTKAVIVDGEGSETIDGALTNVVGNYTDSTYTGQYSFLTICSDGTGWHVINVAGETMASQTNAGAGTNVTNGAWTTGLVSVSLTPGTWLITGMVTFYGESGITGTGNIRAGISIDNSTGFSDQVDNLTTGYNYKDTNWALGHFRSISCPGRYVTITASDVYYLKAYADGFSGGNLDASGSIQATRIG